MNTLQVPEPVFDENPDWIAFYHEAWRLAADHITEREGAPASPYMDEAFDPDTIWIWDTCFMVQFCKYAPETFPGIQSFDNFYQPLHNGVASTLKIQHPDNPPLFAWIEEEYARMTGDTARLGRILPLLVKHFAFVESALQGQEVSGGVVPLAAERTALGYHWNGISSGMDNTPRGRERYEEILWFDLLAQQGLAARHISRLAERAGDTETCKQFTQEYARLKHLANTHYWDDEDGFYYDIQASEPHEKVKVRTPAAYWGLLAGFCNGAQAAKLAAHAEDPQGFGGEVPWPSVTPDDRDFHPDGFYWQGGVWLPMAYMATVALRQNGFYGLGDALAERLLAHMHKTWCEYKPQTIWEAYSPSEAKPATDKAEFSGKRVRPDFCGWSALGPISMFIESVLGFHTVDAFDGRVGWRPRPSGRHGLRNLRFGGITTSLIWDEGTVTVESDGPYTLVLPQGEYPMAPGQTVIRS